MSDTEPLFFINDKQTEIFKYNIFGKNPVCTDDDIDMAAF